MRTHVSIIGGFYLLHGLGLLLAAVALFVAGLAPGLLPLPEMPAEAGSGFIGGGIACAVGAVWHAVLARAMFRLQNWARIWTCIVGAVALLGPLLPLGVYFLWVCNSDRGAGLFLRQVKLYGDDQRGYVPRRGVSAEEAREVPDGHPGDAYPSAGCMFGLFGIGALIVIGLPIAVVVYGSQIREAWEKVPPLEEIVPDPPAESPPAEGPAEGPAAETPPDGEAPEPVLWRRAEQVDGLPGHWAYTDEKGTRHIVNGFLKIPERFRPR